MEGVHSCRATLVHWVDVAAALDRRDACDGYECRKLDECHYLIPMSIVHVHVHVYYPSLCDVFSKSSKQDR
jgi:hypothetical protein